MSLDEMRETAKLAESLFDYEGEYRKIQERADSYSGNPRRRDAYLLGAIREYKKHLTGRAADELESGDPDPTQRVPYRLALEARDANPEYHRFLERLAELRRVNRPTKDGPPKIEWHGNEGEIIALFVLLEESGLISGFVSERTVKGKDTVFRSWKLVKDHFLNGKTGKDIGDLSNAHARPELYDIRRSPSDLVDRLRKNAERIWKREDLDDE